MPLPDDLYRHLRKALLLCSEFESDAALQNVFVTTELALFRARLPGAGNRSGRVDACLNYLTDQKLTDGRPILPLFLFALRDRYQEGDALRNELGALAGEAQVTLGAPATPAVPVAPPPAAALGTDIFGRYEAGVRELLRRLGPSHLHFSETLVYQQRLAENIAQTCYGDTDTLKAGRAEILCRLNGLSQAALGATFNELCGLGAASAGGGASQVGTETPPPDSGKYNIHIGQVTGLAIGDNAQVTQQLGNGATLLGVSAEVVSMGLKVDPDNPPIAAIRELLLAAFSPEELRRLCQDYPALRPIVASFGPGHGLNDMVERVIDYCQTQLMLDTLLQAVSQVNPRQYRRFLPRLRS